MTAEETTQREGFWARYTKKLLVAGAVVVVCAVIAIPRSPEEPIVLSGLSVTGPEVVAAGEAFEVTVEGAAEGQDVTLSVDAGYGPRSFSAPSVDGVATIAVEASTVAESGTATLQATTESANGWAHVEITPGEAVDPLDLYLGPRTVVADAEHHSMIVAVPTDRFGNPVAAGTIVEFVHYTPQSEEIALTAPTQNLLAFIEAQAGTKAGRSRVATTVGQATGHERTFNEVAGITVPFGVSAIDTIPFADGASLVRIETTELVDAFGNQLPDGTLVLLTIDDVKGSRRLTGVTIDGVASFTIEAPSTPRRLELRAESGGTLGDTFEIDFAPAVSSFPVDTSPAKTETGADGTQLDIGPILTVDGSYVPDGTTITIEHNGYELEIVSDEGIASVVIDQIEGTAIVRILGRNETVSFTEQP